MSELTKVIVTTTINPPTEAIKKFIEIGRRDGWVICIVGDKKTPHAAYEELDRDNEHVFYLSPETQERTYPKLSELIGWNCIQRRNFGFIWAHQVDADIVATIDDDNIPDENWGQDLYVGTEREVGSYDSLSAVMDPLAIHHKEYWHRGFPIELLAQRNEFNYHGEVSRMWLVQADMWNGDPDVDAIGRIAFAPVASFKETVFATEKTAPFNSQNTFLHKDAFPHYFLFPHIGRMDDIWAAYNLQHVFPGCVVFGRPSVYQQRNPHNLAKDLEAELLGYKHSGEVAANPSALERILPAQALEAWEEYRRCFL